MKSTDKQEQERKRMSDQEKVYLINFSYDIKTEHVASCLMKGPSEEAVKEKFHSFADGLTNLKIASVDDTSSDEFVKREVEKEEARRAEMEAWEKMMSEMTGEAEPQTADIIDLQAEKDKNKLN